MGSIFSAIGRGINMVISAIANVLLAIVSAITGIFSAVDASVREEAAEEREGILAVEEEEVDEGEPIRFGNKPKYRW
ncbi:hypothetical protein NP233_g4967 [Leucocoprinus birnbaumii]|uniref:Uncharacterized protein n=1 Tax=Leucocoprinus birnbaumii TaxID=56174 RepID=A0AAD5W047_9AGAR|nr:hypothetical protein NP233_g4967 [Leucocoprinus birnbaumii]